jgi:hypothetical protein
MTAPHIPPLPRRMPTDERAAATSSGAPSVAPMPISCRDGCANCGATLEGAYCADCGAARVDRRPLTVSRFREEFWNEVTNLDSTTVRTLRSLFLRPGELTRAYVDGRTRWFLSPIRVYLMLFALFVLGSSLLPGREAELRDSASRVARGMKVGAVAAGANAATETPSVKQASAVAATLRAATENQWLQLINAVTWAWVLALLFRRQRRNYAEHMVMAMHLLAFNVVLLLANLTVRVALHVPRDSLGFMTVLHWLGIGTYFYLAARLVYRESPALTAGKSVLFVAGAQVMMGVPVLLAGIGVAVKLIVQGSAAR